MAGVGRPAEIRPMIEPGSCGRLRFASGVRRGSGWGRSACRWPASRCRRRVGAVERMFDHIDASPRHSDIAGPLHGAACRRRGRIPHRLVPARETGDASGERPNRPGAVHDPAQVASADPPSIPPRRSLAGCIVVGASLPKSRRRREGFHESVASTWADSRDRALGPLCNRLKHRSRFVTADRGPSQISTSVRPRRARWGFSGESGTDRKRAHRRRLA
jgi:hypothetical protein